MLYFPLAEEQNKWKMFSHTPLGPGPEGLFFESHTQCCLSVTFLLSAIADIQFRAPVPTQPFVAVDNIHLLVRYSLLLVHPRQNDSLLWGSVSLPKKFAEFLKRIKNTNKNFFSISF